MSAVSNGSIPTTLVSSPFPTEVDDLKMENDFLKDALRRSIETLNNLDIAVIEGTTGKKLSDEEKAARLKSPIEENSRTGLVVQMAWTVVRIEETMKKCLNLTLKNEQ
jgi:hypothetical protein